jgi:hypothetical protein
MSTRDPALQKAKRPRAAWGSPTASEPRWQPRLAVLAVALLTLTLPEKYTLGPVWLFPALEGIMLVVLTLGIPTRMGDRPSRAAAIVLIAIVNVANLTSLGLLVHRLIHGAKAVNGPELLFSSIAIWLTNVIVFALWYWELDRG